MATWLKQSTAVDVMLGPFLDETDGKTIENTLTITQPDIRLSKNGGAFAQKSAAQTLSHGENGWYACNLSTTDTGTLGSLVVAVHESGALPVWREFMVVPANVYDSMIGDTDKLQADVRQFNDTNGTFASGRPEVNTSHIAGSAVSTSSAQIGVNVVNAGATAWNSGAITANTLASDTIAAAKIATGAITNAKFAAGAIDAAAIAADAIGASELAADAATEIANAVAAHADVAAIKTKTDQLAFGVTNTVNANITYVNEVEVGGSGTTGDPWGPA